MAEGSIQAPFRLHSHTRQLPLRIRASLEPPFAPPFGMPRSPSGSTGTSKRKSTPLAEPRHFSQLFCPVSPGLSLFIAHCLLLIACISGLNCEADHRPIFCRGPPYIFALMTNGFHPVYSVYSPAAAHHTPGSLPSSRSYCPTRLTSLICAVVHAPS
ncbi:hypothetical protein GE09DRAFT_515901 [Coniochaeta sp. 2T2.1]|nr:hypothetical protein GE09DRAFT_515901 [Coniochaeta sp. 2T2.1]